MTRCRLGALALVLLSGCEAPGPPTTDTDSSEIDGLAERVAFLEPYVGPKPYAAASPSVPADSTLVFSVMYQNNGGGLVPGPSDWTIEVVARVPPDSLDTWRGDLTRTDSVDAGWLDDFVAGPPIDGISEWYQRGGRFVGVDRRRGIVAFRSASLY